MTRHDKDARRVLLVSPFPPPSGGIATWTKIVMEKGLPNGFVPILVDTRLTGTHHASSLLRSTHQFMRTVRILFSLAGATIRRRPRLVHLNCSLSPNGIFRDLLCGLID
ncbi:MAG: hypothetical protein OEN01_09510 [Candidatus Krumholzibacteria bacterium]|nr:hypothetical protein [Candidatus Krumholzibacteria bacterium]